MNQLVLSGTATLVPSGTGSSCYRGPESDPNPCPFALSSRRNSSNQKSFGFLLTDRALGPLRITTTMVRLFCLATVTARARRRNFAPARQSEPLCTRSTS